ncbi:hypothetical protein ALC57_17029 [Trachymyrmex cornetzi]|uniref:Uncharacterized protein n=1 Tax=Trachymyrmex cornetzi TaxID=471704 RepID=A0A195DEH8_9HYME|nr:hypothetical protein ALC57_17029 [Trachymyrmex cornetzi]
MHQRLYFISKPVLPICESPLTASKLKTVQVFRPNVSRRTMQSKGRNKAVQYICSCACMMSQILSIHEFHGIGYTLYIYMLRVWLHIMYTRYTY